MVLGFDKGLAGPFYHTPTGQPTRSGRRHQQARTIIQITATYQVSLRYTLATGRQFPGAPHIKPIHTPMEKPKKMTRKEMEFALSRAKNDALIAELWFHEFYKMLKGLGLLAQLPRYHQEKAAAYDSYITDPERNTKYQAS